MGVKEILESWPRPDALIDVAKERDLTSEELLALKSVSFYGPIRLLGEAKGEEEHDKEGYIQTGYNILRELDEGEDALKSVLSVEDKVWTINKFAYLVGEVVRMNGNGNKLDDLIEGGEFRSVTQRLVDGAADERARVFVEQFGNGAVLRDLHSYDRDVRESIDYCTKSMAGGMIRFLERGAIQTTEQLFDYCFHVAGRIGSGLLTKLVELKDNVQLNDELAERFGEFLQITNISKNVRTDYEEGRVFFPAEFRTGVSHEYLMDGKGSDAQEARAHSLDKVLGLAEENFIPSIRYVSSIPNHLSGYKAFCLVPLITAKKTIDHERESGADAVFAGDPEATKIPYGIAPIMKFSCEIATREGGRYANRFLESFGNEPERFPFDPEGLRSWADGMGRFC